MGLFSREPVIGEDEDARLVITGKFPNFVITYGDHEIKQIRSLTLELGADQLPEVTLRLQPSGIEVDAEAYASFEAVFDRKVGVTSAELPKREVEPEDRAVQNDYRGRMHYQECPWVQATKKKLSNSDCICGKGMGVDRPVWGDEPVTEGIPDPDQWPGIVHGKDSAGWDIVRTGDHHPWHRVACVQWIQKSSAYTCSCPVATRRGPV